MARPSAPRRCAATARNTWLGGELTVKGTTRPVALRLTYGGVTDDPPGHRRAGFLGRARFSRAAFGVAETMGFMAVGGPVVGDAIDVILGIEAILESADA